MFKNQIFLYWFFVVLSIALNISIQEIVFFLESKDSILQASMVAMIIAIIITFIFKYIADKKYVYKYEIEKMYDKKSLVFYLIFSLFTTFLFFVVELFFIFVLKDIEFKKEIGATLGLLIGYIIKFILDKNITFKEKK